MSFSLGRALREAGAALKRAGEIEIFARHRPTVNFNGAKPFKTNDTFVAPTAVVIGDVTNWDKSSVWYKAVVRADSNHSITIGFSSCVGEGSVVKTLSSTAKLETGLPPDTYIGHYVTIGSGCVLKSCRVDDLVVIGDKCTILEGTIVDSHVMLEPGTVVMPYQHIPSGQKWGGNPAKFIANLTENEKEALQGKAEAVHSAALDHILEFLPHGFTYVQLEELEKQVLDTKSKKSKA
eukprot:CAMPEP_0198143238 /NCGR_PEP_ID=MMETSP1443-20131203/6131_1 /TAXON_ID=186043 /ORGANISM="Entomoneis sp., Strain CCMP2396" /LENGTH=235 /DNA_ID=CAMNT_0043806443 /DNA_START=135 /DNA_END=842 /DNA_ORIENTATION=+